MFYRNFEGLKLTCGFKVFLNFKREKSILRQLQKIRNRIILYISKNFEDNKHLITRNNFKDTLSKRRTKDQRRKRLWQIVLGGFLGLFAFLSRYYYLQFDTFSFSDLWFVEFSYIKDITAQHWFFVSDSMVGEYLIINLYAGLSGISDMIALRSFGLLESALLTIIIYWAVSKITTTRRTPGLFAALFFIVLYKFLPLNLDLMTQHKPIFLALTLALPTLIFIIKPKLLNQNLIIYSRWMTYIFCAVLLTNLFVSLLFALYFPIAFLFTYKKNKAYLKRSLIAYLGASLLISILYYIASIVMNVDLVSFLYTNLYAINSYTYTPQLLLPITQLMEIYRWTALISLVISIAFYVRNKLNWETIVVFLLLINSVFSLGYYQEAIVDADMFYQIVSVLVPILYGICLYIVIALFSLLFKIETTNSYVGITTAILLILGIFFYSNEGSPLKIPQRNQTLEETFKVYNQLNRTLLPFSYAVVDINRNSVLSRDNHFFMSYNYFNKKYLEKDEQYAMHKSNESYLKKHPDIIPPNDTYVFVYEKKKKTKDLENARKPELVLQNSLEILKKRGRTISLFFKSNKLKVYQVENVPRSSQINDLLF